MADGIVITGPTASGKTDLAIAVARRIGGEIISLDSRQVYRGMDIGTAKPTAAQREAVPHFGIDLVSPDERYSAGRFATDARRWIAEIDGRGHVPVLVGGTGFFLRALTHPMFAEPVLPPRAREAMKRYLATLSHEELLRWLAVLDEQAAARLRQEGGRQRAARAVEVALLTGRTLTDWQRDPGPQERPLAFQTFVLELPREDLYRRIDERVAVMLAAGLVEEVQTLLDAGYDENAPGMNATGYIELIPCLRRHTSLEAAADAIRRATRRYARRQLTWFRHQLGPGALTLDARRPRDELVAAVVAEVESPDATSVESAKSVKSV